MPCKSMLGKHLCVVVWCWALGWSCQKAQSVGVRVPRWQLGWRVLAGLGKAWVNAWGGLVGEWGGPYILRFAEAVLGEKLLGFG